MEDMGNMENMQNMQTMETMEDMQNLGNMTGGQGWDYAARSILCRSCPSRNGEDGNA